MAKKAKRTNYPDRAAARTANETTGVISSNPQNQEEYDSYQDIAGMATPKRNNKNKK
jgi:hypothetical protein